MVVAVVVAVSMLVLLLLLLRSPAGAGVTSCRVQCVSAEPAPGGRGRPVLVVVRRRRLAGLARLAPLHALLLLPGQVGGGVGLGALQQGKDQRRVRLVRGVHDRVVLQENEKKKA